MSKIKRVFAAFSFLLFTPLLFAQRSIKFGAIKPEDFAAKTYPIDVEADGIVLSDIGASEYEPHAKGGFNINFKRHTRIRLLNRKSFDEATITIPLYFFNSYEERIIKIEASTFNIENGQVVETKLDKNSIFQEKLNSRYIVKKFTMPNLKEGCIIDIKYTLASPYEQDLRSWYFQGNLPVLYSEYETSIPAIYDFVILNQGYHPFKTKTNTSYPRTYMISYNEDGGLGARKTFSLNTQEIRNVWAMENIPKLKSENFLTALSNHIAKIEFQLSAIIYPNEPARPIMNNWSVAAEQLLKRENFGSDLTKNASFYVDELKTITGNKEASLENAKKIYNYVKENINCNNHDALFTRNPLKKVYQDKNGNVAEINLLLTAMLKNQGFEAHPVVLSTRHNGKAMNIYPIIDKLNYVICQVIINDEEYLLDASHKKLGFAKLHSDVYNGFARVIDVNPVAINLQADSLVENKVTSVILFNADEGGLIGTYNSYLGNNESYNLRETLTKKSTEEYFKEVKSVFPAEFKLSDPFIDSLKINEAPIFVKYGLLLGLNDEDIIYFNPMMTEAFKENPFKAAERFYPVEMDAAINKTYVLNMDIPKGYSVDEVPKSVRVMFNENEGMFEYIVQKNATSIQLSCKLKLLKATFEPDEYQTLRDFFGFIVKKQSEQIVFKKI